VSIETPHGIPALLVFSQNLRDELASGQFAVLSFYVVTGDIDPKLQGLVHSNFHCSKPFYGSMKIRMAAA
jgi:hypothetical protein